MLNRFKSLKNNSSGYIMVYVMLLMGFITILFAGTAMALNNRTRIASRALDKQQLQITAQSALGTIVDEFENNADLKAKLQAYAEGSQSAKFELSNETGIDDDIEVKITKEPGQEGKARITVTASNASGSISSAFALIDYTLAPQGESSGVVDNLIVAYNLKDAPYSQYALGSNEGIYNQVLDGRVIVNNKNSGKTLTAKGATFSALIANGDIQLMDNEIRGVEGGDGIIASLDGSILFHNRGRIVDDSIKTVAAKKDITVRNDNFYWNSPGLDFITGNGGDITFNDITGEIGNIISGGDISLTSKDNNPLTINGDILSKNSIKLNEQHKVATVITGDVISGEDLEMQGMYKIGKNIAAVANIKASKGTTSIELTSGGIYAGRDANFNSIRNLFVNGDILCGANYRNGDGGSTKNNYLNNKNRGSLTFANGNSKDVKVSGNIVVNSSTNIKNDNNITTAKVYELNGRNAASFSSRFNAANSAWRGLIKRVEKGGVTTEGYIDLAVALTDSEAASGNKLDSFTLTNDAKAYYVNSEGTAVSHSLGFTVNDSKYILRQEIAEMLGGVKNSYTGERTQGRAAKIFEEAIPDAEDAPDVTIPEWLKYTYATVSKDGSDVNVINGGYIKVNGYTITAKDSSGQVANIQLNWGDRFVFDTTAGKTYDIMLGNADVENSANSGDVSFPWSICVNQPKENMGFVRIFLGDNTNLYLNNGGEIVNIGSAADCIPEVYFFSNGCKTIKADNYTLTGYMIIPNGLVDLFNGGVQRGTNKVFEGIMLCGNVGMPQRQDRVLKYYKPLMYQTAITSDVFGY